MSERYALEKLRQMSNNSSTLATAHLLAGLPLDRVDVSEIELLPHQRAILEQAGLLPRVDDEPEELL